MVSPRKRPVIGRDIFNDAQINAANWRSPRLMISVTTFLRPSIKCTSWCTFTLLAVPRPVQCRMNLRSRQRKGELHWQSERRILFSTNCSSNFHSLRKTMANRPTDRRRGLITETKFAPTFSPPAKMQNFSFPWRRRKQWALMTVRCCSGFRPARPLPSPLRERANGLDRSRRRRH